MKKTMLAIMAAVCLVALGACGKKPETTTLPTLPSQEETTVSQTETAIETSPETVPEAGQETVPETKRTAEYYCGTWEVSRATMQDVTLSIEDWIKLGMDPAIGDIVLILQNTGKCYFVGGDTVDWKPTDDGISIENTTCPLMGDEIVIAMKEATLYLKKVSEEQTFPEAEEDVEETTSSGIRPEFKEAMDTYEAFYDEYCELMKKYKENPTDLTILTKYLEMMSKIEEVDKAFEAWDSSDMSSEELKYYLDVSARIQKKLIDLF